MSDEKSLIGLIVALWIGAALGGVASMTAILLVSDDFLSMWLPLAPLLTGMILSGAVYSLRR